VLRDETRDGWQCPVTGAVVLVILIKNLYQYCYYFAQVVNNPRKLTTKLLTILGNVYYCHS